MARGGGKYGARKTPCQHGHTHASGREAKRCNDLHLLERGGLISRLTQQPQFWFTIDGRQIKHDNGRRVGYQADFQYFEGGKNVVEDSKGCTVRDWPLRKAVFRALFPHIELREV
jgi:hypothetical protein